MTDDSLLHCAHDQAEHKPQHALVMLTRIIRLANLAPPLTAMLNAPLSNLQNIVAATERNLRLPMFIPYTQNILRFLLGWIMFLPLALFPKMGWYSVPAVTAISALLLGIEELGTQIEVRRSLMIFTWTWICRSIIANARLS